MLIAILKSLGTGYANESIHGSRAAVWHSENQVTDGLGFLKELKSVFRKGSRKKRDDAVWETIEQLELDF